VNILAEATRHAFLLTALAGIVLGGVSLVAIPAVFGRSFGGAVGPLLILIPGAIAWAPASMLSNYFTMRLGKMRYPLSVAAFSGVTTGLLCLVLIPALGIKGAALASAVGYTSAICLEVAFFLRATGSGIGAIVPRGSDLVAYRELSQTLLRRQALAGRRD
jgi:O-antigen/teichoic acid export membrane protein